MSKIIYIVGGSGSGKTTIAEKLVREFYGERKAELVSADNFFRDFSKADLSTDFDVPQAYDENLIHEKLVRLRAGHPVEIPHYDFATRKADLKVIHVPADKYIIVEGLFLLYHKKLRELCDFSIFIKVDLDVQLARRLLRDQKRLRGSGENLTGQIERYFRDVKPGYLKYIAPSMELASAVVENDGELGTCFEQVKKALEKKEIA
ncbi:MAG: hypothetical protein NTZ80_04035 [Patescibacteria group bacterium]|nr:hypothetical protein [Patescibacteria group bacterium]